jgi:predicted RNase H-like HicB family nuclease
MQRQHTYTVHIEPAEEGGFVVSVPALPGCHTQGETYDEAIRNAHEAVAVYVDSLIKHGDPIPTEPEPKGPIDVLVQIGIGAAA